MYHSAGKAGFGFGFGYGALYRTSAWKASGAATLRQSTTLDLPGACGALGHTLFALCSSDYAWKLRVPACAHMCSRVSSIFSRYSWPFFFCILSVSVF